MPDLLWGAGGVLTTLKSQRVKWFLGRHAEYS